MEPKERASPLGKAAREKADAAIEHARQVREKAEEDRRRKRQAEIVSHSEPHLVSYGLLNRCSACGHTFPADVKPSMSVAFADHLAKAHQPGQTSENFSQAGSPNNLK
jgi:hypothetical protein